MKKILFTCAICIVCMMETSAKGKKELTILHTNDTHSCILPLNVNLADTMLAGRGGFLRRIAMLKEERKKDSDLLYFDSGDFSQGSTFYSLYKGDVEIGLMNKMGIDASTIGNHEFDFGMENMARIFKMATFPILCSNYDFTGTFVEGVVKPYIIIKRKGIKIGVFALNPKMEGLVLEKNCPGVKFLDPTTVANEMVTMLKKEKKCNIVICISHLGWTNDQYSDINVFSKTRGIDLILGGHSHTYFDTLQYVEDLDGKQIPVDQNGKNGIFIGKLTLNFEKKK